MRLYESFSSVMFQNFHIFQGWQCHPCMATGVAGCHPCPYGGAATADWATAAVTSSDLTIEGFHCPSSEQLSPSEFRHPLADGGIARGYVQLSVVSSKLLDVRTLGLNERFRRNVEFYTKCLFDIRKIFKRCIAVLMRFAISRTISIRSLKEIGTCV